MTVSYPIGRSYDEANLARAEVEQRQVASRIASLQLQIAEAVRRAAREVQSTAERMEAARAGETLAEQRVEVEQPALRGRPLDDRSWSPRPSAICSRRR